MNAAAADRPAQPRNRDNTTSDAVRNVTNPETTHPTKTSAKNDAKAIVPAHVEPGLQRNVALQPGISRARDFAHSAGSDLAGNFVWPESSAGTDGHCYFAGTRAFSSSNQLRTTRNSAAVGFPVWVCSEASKSPRILASGVTS